MSAMRTAVISLLVPLVRGSCLPDAIQPGQRQNLVNLNGETYPVGFMVGSWAASYAAHILAATLVEEILGYNTTTTIGADVASGSVAGYYGIAGCRTFNDIADRGCMKGVMQMLAWPWKVPLLNATDCIISFCVVLLVTTSTLYLNEIDETMYGFASAVSTVMLSSIGGAIGIMFLMTGSALFYRSAMGGKKELKFFNLGSVPQSDDLAKKVKEMVGELEAMEVAELSKKLNALAVFDISKLTTCITLLATEVAPPAQDAYSFKFNKRIASSSFDPALKRKQQTLRQSHSKEETKVGEADNALVESDETTQQSWM